MKCLRFGEVYPVPGYATLRCWFQVINTDDECRTARGPQEVGGGRYLNAWMGCADSRKEPDGFFFFFFGLGFRLDASETDSVSGSVWIYIQSGLIKRWGDAVCLLKKVRRYASRLKLKLSGIVMRYQMVIQLEGSNHLWLVSEGNRWMLVVRFETPLEERP